MASIDDILSDIESVKADDELSANQKRKDIEALTDPLSDEIEGLIGGKGLDSSDKSTLADVYADLIADGVIDYTDVLTKGTGGRGNGDGKVQANSNGLLKGGSGDDYYVGQDGVQERFFFDGRDGRNDEGRHVNVVSNFTIGEDTMSFRMDGGYFKDAGDDGTFTTNDGDKLEQSSNGNQANFSTANDIADLLLHVNYRGTVDDQGYGKQFNYRGFESEAAADAAKESAESWKDIRNASEKQSTEVVDSSFVKVVGEHIIINIDDNRHREDHYNKDGKLVTTDKMIVLENFEEELASKFAQELGYDAFDDAKKSNADSVHILGQNGDHSVSGGSGDNLFIMSAQKDTIQLDDRNHGNDEGKAINIIHGFDLAEDSISGRFDGKFFDGSNQATFKGAAGVVELLTSATNIEEKDGNLSFDLFNEANNRELTVVLTDTTLDAVYEASQTQVFEALIASGAIAEGTVPPAPGGNGDGIILNGNDNKGDDILSGIGVDVFKFDSRDGAEDGTGNTDDGLDHVNVVLGFNSGDSLNFRIDGGYFSGLAESLPDVDVNGGNKAVVGYDGIDELGAYINTLGGANKAFHDAATNSTILTIDDSPSNPDDNVTIVLWDSGNLL